MTNILIIYSSTDGHTFNICERMRSVYVDKGFGVNIVSVRDCQHLDLHTYDQIMIGASIRYGKHSKEIYSFIDQNCDQLDKVKNAFFSVNLVARKENKNSPDTNPYCKKFLNQIEWKPKQCAVFAGKINYPKYNFLDRIMIQLIMFMTKGPTDPKTVKSYTDWDKVDQFAKEFIKIG
jgi:menaquinone-dependent protoporphyrinogen oxidase